MLRVSLNKTFLSFISYNRSRASLEGRKEMFSLTNALNTCYLQVIWRQIYGKGSEETHCRHMVFSFRLAARVLLYALSHRHDSTYHGLCYTSYGVLAGIRKSLSGSTMKDRSDNPIVSASLTTHFAFSSVL